MPRASLPTFLSTISPRGLARPAAGALLALALIAVAIAVSPGGAGVMGGAGWRLKAPAFALIAAASPVLQLHLFSALTALAVGAVIMLRPKGVGLHKALGWAWVLAMASTAGSSFLLNGLNGDRLSFVHLLSGWTIVSLPIGLLAIRQRNVARHRQFMTGLFTGGLLIAGALTFLPGRLMWRVFFQ
jgi:uncharacterized membrane protein